MNEHAQMISRLDTEISRTRSEITRVRTDMVKIGEYGDMTLTQTGKRRERDLMAELASLEQSSEAAYGMRA